MSNIREAAIRILALALTSAVVLSLLASSNSLLFSQYRFDYVAFRIIGEGWAAGQIPFRDFFDHKGPFIFFIQMLASFISKSKVVIWGLELVWIVTTLEMLFRCGRYIGVSKSLNYLSMVVALMIYACFVDGGNTVELWSLPFEVLPLLLLLRSLRGRTKLSTVAFVGGLCFGLVAMIRINNNAMITGLVIGVVIYLCCRREYSKIFQCACWFLFGMALGVIPFVIYFRSVGAFDDFIYCTFTFSLRYIGQRGTSLMEALCPNSKQMFPCLIFLAILCLYSMKRGVELLIVLAPAAIIIFLTFSFGRSYPHYYLMTLPVAALSIQMLWPLKRYVQVSVFVIYIISCGYILRVLAPFRINRMIQMREAEAKFPGVTGQQFISDFIPDSEKGSIYTYGESDLAAAVDANGYLPVGKYFFFQEVHQAVDPKVHNDIFEKFKAANPKWVISSSEDMGPLQECMTGYVEIPVDSLPSSCPESWHIYLRK